MIIFAYHNRGGIRCSYMCAYIHSTAVILIGNRVSKLDLPLSKTSPIVVISTPCIYEAKACIVMSTGNEKAYWSNDVSTRAVVAKRGKCIVRTTGHYSDAKYKRICFLNQRALHWNDLNTSKVHLRESRGMRLFPHFQQIPPHIFPYSIQ